MGRTRAGWFVLLLLAPTVATGLLLFAAMSRLLAAGVLARPTWGALALVHLVTLVAMGA